MVLQPKKGRNASAPKFSGNECECPHKFVAEIVKYCETTDIPRNEWTIAAADRLRGEAARWFEHYREMDLPFEEFESRIIAAYDSLDMRGKLFARLYGQRQDDECAAVFLCRKRALMRRLMPFADDLTIITQMKTMLKPEVRIHLRSARIADVEQLIQMATEIEGDLQETKRSQPRGGGNKARNNAPPRRESGVPRYPCRHCGEGHYERSCPRRPANAQLAIEGNPRSENATRVTPQEP